MAQEEAIKLFESAQIRVVWDDEKEKYFFSIVDIVRVLTNSVDFQTARKYWNKLKQRLKQEGNESVTNCHQLKLEAADGKRYRTDVARNARADIESRLGHSVISSDKAIDHIHPKDELPFEDKSE